MHGPEAPKLLCTTCTCRSAAISRARNFVDALQAAGESHALTTCERLSAPTV